MKPSSSSVGNHPVTRTARAVVPLLLLAALIAHLGTDPFARSLNVLEPGPILAALLLGVITTTAQALRWRTVAIGYDAATGLTRVRAISECYRSALLNAVLPGGVLGDAVRAWRQRSPRERGLRTSAQAVIGERVAGTVVLLLAVAVVLLPSQRWIAALALVGAGVAAVIAVPSLRRLAVGGQFAVWGWSLLALASLVTKFALAAWALGTVPQMKDVVMLALVVLAGMSIPIGIGGFGPREAVAAIAFASVGLSADSGVATAAAFGVLAAVSAVPGVLVMLIDLRETEAPVATVVDLPVPVAVPDSAAVESVESVELGELVELADVTVVRRPVRVLGEVRRDRHAAEALAASRRQIQFDTDVLTEEEPARRSA